MNCLFIYSPSPFLLLLFPAVHVEFRCSFVSSSPLSARLQEEEKKNSKKNTVFNIKLNKRLEKDDGIEHVNIAAHTSLVPHIFRLPSLLTLHKCDDIFHWIASVRWLNGKVLYSFTPPRFGVKVKKFSSIPFFGTKQGSCWTNRDIQFPLFPSSRRRFRVSDGAECFWVIDWIIFTTFPCVSETTKFSLRSGVVVVGIPSRQKRNSSDAQSVGS